MNHGHNLVFWPWLTNNQTHIHWIIHKLMSEADITKTHCANVPYLFCFVLSTCMYRLHNCAKSRQLAEAIASVSAQWKFQGLFKNCWWTSRTVDEL